MYAGRREGAEVSEGLRFHGSGSLKERKSKKKGRNSRKGLTVTGRKVRRRTPGHTQRTFWDRQVQRGGTCSVVVQLSWSYVAEEGAMVQVGCCT